LRNARGFAKSPLKKERGAVDFDLFISYASEDLDLCVADFVKALWRHGVNSIWFDRFSIDVRESIPGKIDEGLSKSRYMLCVLTSAYFGKFWTREELDAIRMQQKQVIPIWVDTIFQEVNAFSPALANKKPSFMMAMRSCDVSSRSDSYYGYLYSVLCKKVRPG
jgi:hypothetical protein